MNVLKVLAFSFIAVNLSSCQKEATLDIGSAKAKVKLDVVKTESIPDELVSFGSVSFLKKIDLSSRMEGEIAEMVATEGARVRSGEILARLRNIQLETARDQAEVAVRSAVAQVQLAKAKLQDGVLNFEARIVSIEKTQIELDQKRVELDEMGKNLEKKETLLKAGGATEESVASLRLSYASAKVNLQSMEKDLEIKRIGLRDADLVASGMKLPSDPEKKKKAFEELNTQELRAELEVAKAQAASAEMEFSSNKKLLEELIIKAPEAGIVGAKYGERGERVAANTKLLTLIITDKVYAVFPVQEAEAARVTEGMAVEILIDALGSDSIQGRVELVSPMIDAQSGALSVKALFSNGKESIKPGMFARVKVRLGPPVKRILFPSTAVVQKKGDKAKVFTVVNGKSFLKEVTIGKEIEAYLVALEGLKEGERVIDSPSQALREGIDVEVIE